MTSEILCSCGQESTNNSDGVSPSCAKCHPPLSATLALTAEIPVPAVQPQADQTLDAPSWPAPPSPGSSPPPASGSSTGGASKPTLPNASSKSHARSLPHVPGYEILGELGRGGMGVVYKARQVGLNRLVALKMILSNQHAGVQQIQRFRAEAEAVARMHHPNIVQIYEVGEQDGNPFFSLEFVAGGTLADRLEKERLTFRDAAELLETLARAMQYAHDHGIVHRDLKPANILMQGDNAPIAPSRSTGVESGVHRLRGPKIADFGLAKNIDSGQHNTQSGAILGTPSYMAPEQACGDVQEIGPAADIYALGTILYELLAGKPPFSGGSSIDIINKVMREDPVPPRRLQPWTPRDLEIICLKCLHKVPKRRYASAEELAEDLRRFLDHEPIRARAASIGERAVRWARQHPAWAGLAAGLLVAVSLVVSFEIRRQQNARHLRQTQYAEARALLDNATGAAKEERYEQARELLDQLRPRLTEELPASIRSEASELNREVDGRLGGAKAYQQFLERRDVALFHAGSGNYKAAAEASRAALDLYTATRNQDGHAIVSVDQAGEMARGCIELTLVIAQAQAQPLPGDTAAQCARRGLAVLDSASEQALKTRAFHLRRAYFLEQTGDPSAADERARANSCPIEGAFDYFLIGEEQLVRDQTSEALTSFSQAVRLQPNRFWAWYYQALCYVRQGEMALARASLSASLAQSKDVVWPYLLRGFVNGQLRDYAAAEEDFNIAERILEHKPDLDARYVLLNNRAVVRLGRLNQMPRQLSTLVSAERWQLFVTAIDDLRQATELKPDQYQTWATLAQAWHDQGKPDEAAALLDQTLILAERQMQAGTLSAETVASLYRNRSRWQEKAGTMDGALASLSMITELDLPPQALAKTLAEMGHLCARANRYAEAIEQYDRALEVAVDFPGRSNVLTARAECLLKDKRWSEAATAFDEVLRSGTAGKTNLLAGRALARLRQEPADRDGALADLSLALALQPGNRAVRTQRGRLALSLGQTNIALADFNEVLAQEQTLPALLGRAQALATLGHYERAVKDAENALRLPGVTAVERYAAAEVYATAVGTLDEKSQGRAPTMIEEQSRVRYQERALDLVRSALAELPLNERPGFWNAYPARDRALLPVRGSVGFQRLQQEYNP